MSCESSYPK